MENMETDFDEVNNIPLNKIRVKPLELIDNQNSKVKVLFIFFSLHFIINRLINKIMIIKV